MDFAMFSDELSLKYFSFRRDSRRIYYFKLVGIAVHPSYLPEVVFLAHPSKKIRTGLLRVFVCQIWDKNKYNGIKVGKTSGKRKKSQKWLAGKQ